MLEWLRELTTPRAANEETAHREFVLRAVLISSVCLLTVYLLIDWLLIVPTRGTLAFGNFFWPPVLPLLLFDYWLVRRGHVVLASYVGLALITLATLASMVALRTRDICPARQLSTACSS